MRTTPNPASKILSAAQVARVGLAIPPQAIQPPAGMGVLVLYVPLAEIERTAPMIQADLGLPWNTGDGEPIWFPDHPA